MRVFFATMMTALGLRVLAWNTATTDQLWKEVESSGDREGAEDAAGSLAYGVACNAEPVAEDEWIKLASYKTWRDGSRNRWVQKFEREDAEKMARGFNSLVGRMGRFMRGAPIFAGHPDCDPQRWPDEKRLGKIEELEAREDGIYGRPAWNAAGRENLEQGYLVWPSVAWRFPKKQKGSAYVTPDMFQSVGLTNSPADFVDPVSYNAEADDFLNEENNNDKNTMDPKLLEMLGLGEGATIEDVIAKVAELNEAAAAAEGAPDPEEMKKEMAEMESAAEEERKKLEGERDEALNALAADRSAQAEMVIGNAIESGAITEREKAGWEERFKTDHVAAMNAIGSVQPGGKLNTKPVEIDRAKKEAGDRQERMTAVNAEVSRRMESLGESHETAWNAVKRDKNFGPHFEAMHAGGEEEEG